MQRSKAYRAASAAIDHEHVYSPLEALRLAVANTTTKFDPSVDVAMRLGVAAVIGMLDAHAPFRRVLLDLIGSGRKALR